ncbi:MAG: MFS transporter [Deltaproteobacteria bacterium]|nr:MFS transporter [Deltaproteobacteria bacterium]
MAPFPFLPKRVNWKNYFSRTRDRWSSLDTLTDNPHSFTRAEVGPVIVVSLICALRLLGIFLILPVFSVYAVQYAGASIAMAGVAFGIYALTQSILQIPLGWASDRWGRRPVLLFGLALFTLGSVGCGLAQNISQLILARVIQGTGAVGSVALAALADLTRPAVRTQAFTITGIAIGSAFMIGILGGPLLAARIGLSGLFYILAALALLAMILAAISFPQEHRSDNKEAPMAFKPILLHNELRPIFIATFVLSFALNLFFFTYPLSWAEVGLHRSQLWKVYLIIFLPSVLLVFPYMRHAEKRGRYRMPILIGWLSAAAGYAIYLVGAQSDLLLYLSGAAFFFGYSLFQPLLPAFLTKRIPLGGRGTATGVYTFFGFIGSSLGGILGGALIHISPSLPEFLGVILLVLWYFAGLPTAPESTS